MSREIKFRVWSRVFKKFTNGYEDENRINYDELYSDPPGLFFGGLSAIQNDGDYVLQQYTGLKDKNGVEIYEGDIYNLEGWSENPYYCVWYEGVYWNKRHNQSQKDFLKIHVNVDGDMQHTLRDHCKYVSVIGNIFENPELINE